jgi:hypothetical protein
MNTPSPLILLAACLLPMLACAAEADISKPMPHIEARTPVAVTTANPPKKLEFSLWKSKVGVNDVAGVIIRLGYASHDEDSSLFEQKAGSGADFRLGATLQYLDYRSCGLKDLKGGAYSKIKWELFSVRHQKVVYDNVIDASYWTDTSLPGDEFSKQLSKAMIDNLLGDSKFAEAVQIDTAGGAEASKSLPPLALTTGQAFSGRVTQNAPTMLSAVVTIESGHGTGTGFYISQEGYLLTNQHVVGDAKFVRIRLAGGRSVVGEVLRTDTARDVALVRADPVTSPVLRPRRGEARIGEEVYLLGSPFGDALSGSMTRGIVSSRRVFDGIAFLQSDVAVNPGNSGGPLLDSDGSVLGLAQIDVRGAKGIALFIPIEEALDKLSLTLADKAALAPK